MYQYLALETEQEHAERVGADEETYEWGGEDEDKELGLSKRLRAEPETTGLVKRAGTTEKVICSCGSYTCGYIRTFGLPRSVYEAEIAGLPNQTAKDSRARELRG